MARSSVSFVCQQCGAISPKWSGRCDDCGAWNTLAEERNEAPSGPGKRAQGRRISLEALDLPPNTKPLPRHLSHISEFDRVSGGGLVPGSATLIGGDPGIGKSTLLLQLVCKLASGGLKAAYISGEESADQVRMRARRLGLSDTNVQLATATNASDIAASLGGADGPDVIVIDSIQTMYLPTLDSAPGTVSQVRATAQELIRSAKQQGAALLIVGHVTKDGAIAGPRVLEHMVDSVLYFEGDRSHHFRILRSVKNRFGATDEIGVFEMVETGLAEVPNPSELFLADRRDEVTGAVVFAGVPA
ncbi:MAG: DNA repair protein RadA, partial [Candidatus Puniceispirillum sp.]|nr:DNA repair protein RadA [Candidatus Puniceispirillum sp.]